MKLGILTNILCDKTLEEALGYCKELGIEMVEVGCGGTPGTQHCDPEILLHDGEKLNEFRRTFEKYGMEISAFSCHGNPVHPVKEIADRYDRIMKNAVLMAEAMGVDTICCFSGNPGANEKAVSPLWSTTVWPFDSVIANKWGWEQRLIPYWKNFAEFAKAHGVTHIALEMHPGFAVYNPKTLLRLREAVGPEIGANFDPSHLIWQGIDIPTAIESLAGCIYHFHAKDTYVDPLAMGKNGFFDPLRSLGEGGNPPFSFRIPGNGTGVDYWRQIMVALSQSGYNGAISIENEDLTLPRHEALCKAVRVLREIMISEPGTDHAWREPIRAYQRTFLANDGGENV